MKKVYSIFWIICTLFSMETAAAHEKIYFPIESIIIASEGMSIDLNNGTIFPITTLQHDERGYYVVPHGKGLSWPWWVCSCGYINLSSDKCCGRCFKLREDARGDLDDEDAWEDDLDDDYEDHL